jgi:hypothetical protein
LDVIQGLANLNWVSKMGSNLGCAFTQKDATEFLGIRLTVLSSAA